MRLHAQGWSIATIARYLDVSRPTIYEILKRWVEEGVQGLPDKSHANTSKPGVDLPTRNLIRKKQEENPLLGEWRMFAALKQLGISVSPRTCGRIMAENRRLYAVPPKPGEPHKPKPHPFKATARHERWCLDIRYLEKHRIPEIKGSFYVITVMDAFSRAILSSDIFQSQDLSCVLIVLYAAIERFGAPKKLITDNGGVFRAKQLLAICEALDIEKEYIHKRQSWENLVETHLYVIWNLNDRENCQITCIMWTWDDQREGQFHIINVMRRMSQVHFEQVTSWQGAKTAHERFVTDYNLQPHWAHRKREDHRLSTTTTLIKRNVIECFREMKHMNPQKQEKQIEQTSLPKELPELGQLHARIAPHFQRSEVRARARHFLEGLLGRVERKNGWQLAEEEGESGPQGMQRLLNAADWDEEAVRDELRGYVLEHLEDEHGVLVIDETGFVKKGKKSAGVARQYSGTAGRRENSQIGVFLVYASRQEAAFIDRALYLPEEWTADRVRCREAGIPDQVKFATKGTLAKQMLGRAFAAGVKADWVLADTVYGYDEMRKWLEDQRQPYVLAVPETHQVWSGGEQREVGWLAALLPPEAWVVLSAGDLDATAVYPRGAG